MPNWFFKYKIYHLFFWFAYHFGWWSLSSGGPVGAMNNILFSPYSTKFLFYVVFQALGVYFNLYYLMPKYLETANYVKYLFSVLITIIATAALIITGYYLTAYWSDSSFETLFGDTGFIKLLITNSLPSTVASMTLAMSIKLAKNWIRSKERQQLLEKEKLETELKFLKSQFNPHFLFNTINSIFVLIHKNPNMASDSLAKFSDLLRYQLYECNEAKISLQREMDYLWNFIELGRLRLDNMVEVKITVPKMIRSDIEIAPFILMPFLENAFKHVSQVTGSDNWLHIEIRPNDHSIEMHISNSTIADENSRESEVMGNGGIGLINVRRRLDLLYPDLYTLEVFQKDGSYTVSLRMQLSDYNENTIIEPEPTSVLQT